MICLLCESLFIVHWMLSPQGIHYSSYAILSFFWLRCQFLWGPFVQYHRSSLCTYWPQKSLRLGRKPASDILATNTSDKIEVFINFCSSFFCPFYPRLFWQVRLDSSVFTCLPLVSSCSNPLHVMVSSFLCSGSCSISCDRQLLFQENSPNLLSKVE